MGVILLNYWFSLNSSEKVTALTLAFCSIQQHFIRDIPVKFGIPNLPQSPDIRENSDGHISDFRISGQSLIKENSRTNDGINMKHGPVTKIDKRNKTTSKKIDDNVMLANCDDIVIFPIFGQSGAMRKPNSRQ